MPAQSTTDELFPETPTGRQPVVAFPFTIRARLGAWPVELVITAKPAELGRYLSRLEELGYTPDEPAPAAPAQKPARPKVEPVYQPDGSPCCPVHHKPLVEGQYGLYCSAKARPGEEQNAKGYCALKFAA